MRINVRMTAAGLALLAWSAGLCADTIPGGDVSGTWYAANSPYYITGDITIPAGDTLIIEPGVSVSFLGNYALAAAGLLEAVGTEADSIRFFPEDTAAGWKGIDVASSGILQHALSYCTFSHAAAGLGSMGATNLDAAISHCSFRRNAVAMNWMSVGIVNLQIADCSFCDNGPTDYGAAIVLLDIWGPVAVSRCLFENNAATGCGGAIYINSWDGYDLEIGDCSFLGNASVSGGAIYARDFYNGTIAVGNCLFGGNSASSMNSDLGGGAIWGSQVDNFDISHCCFYDNWAQYGSAVNASPSMGSSDFKLDHCTFRGSSGSVEVWGVGYTLSTMDVSNCIFTRCDYALCNHDNITLTVRNTDFRDNGTDIEHPPAGFGVLAGTNHNGDSCDVYYNIFMDPMFADTADLDFHLSASSPCIDAGDTAFAHDPDGTVTDMGAYWFDQRAPAAALSDSALDFGGVTVGGQAGLGLVVYNQGTANLTISGLANGLPVFATDYAPADSLIPPGDSLALTVTFTPADTSAVFDTLVISNNDRTLSVALSGQGLPTGVAGRPGSLPRRFAMRQARPNPARSGARFSFDLPAWCMVQLKLYDILGAEAATVYEGGMGPGRHDIGWDRGSLPGGVYFYRLVAGEHKYTGRMVLLR